MGAFLGSQSLAVTIVVGLAAMVVLVVSADHVVARVMALADYFNLSATFMGMTVLSLATSIPEITSHLTASVGILNGSLDYEIGSAIVLGANIGSDVVQQTFILGLVVFMAGSLYFRRYFLWKSMIPMIGTTIMCLILGWDRGYSRLDGAILFGAFIAYTYYLYVDERKYYHKDAAQQEEAAEEGLRGPADVARTAVIALALMALTIFAAQTVLHVTERIVEVTGVGGSLLGVVTLGVASALPELTTAVSGVRRNHTGVSLGTLIGSNITNPLVAIGGGALVSTYWVPIPLIHWDLPWETLTGAVLWGIAWFTKGRLGKLGAIYLMALYFVYVILRAVFFAVD